MTFDEAFDVLRRMLKFWANQDDDGPTDAEATQAVAFVGMVNEDVRVAAGECRVAIPSPGTDAARLLTANVMLRRALQRAEQNEIEARAEESEQRAQAADWKEEVTKAKAALYDYADDAGAYPYMRAEVIRLKAEVARLGDEFAALNGHVAEAQELLLREGAECGTDGSVIVGIQRLIAQRDDVWHALTLVEWSGSSLRLECPLCHGAKEKDHHAECLFAQARRP